MHVAVINADQQLVSEKSGFKLGVDPVVRGEARHALGVTEIILLQRAVIGWQRRIGRVREATTTIEADRRLLAIMAPFGVRMERRDVAEVVLEVIAHARLTAPEQRLRIVEIVRPVDGQPGRARQKRPEERQEAPTSTLVLVILIVEQASHLGAVAELEGRGRGEQQPLVVLKIHVPLGVAVEHRRADIEERRHRAGDRCCRFAKAVRAALDLDLATEGVRRAAADLVEDASRRRRAIKHRRRPFEDVERLERVKIDADRGNGRSRGHRETVDILLRREAADGDEVIARIGSVILAERTGGVANGLLRIDEVEQIDLVAGDDRDRLRRLDQRNIGLRRGDRSCRNEVARRDDDFATVRFGRLERVAGVRIGRRRCCRRVLGPGGAGHERGSAGEQRKMNNRQATAARELMC